MNRACRKKELIEANELLRQRLEADFENIEPALELADNGIAAARTAFELREFASALNPNRWASIPGMILKNILGRWR
jgi:hypothetical protein